LPNKDRNEDGFMTVNISGGNEQIRDCQTLVRAGQEKLIFAEQLQPLPLAA